MSLRLFNLGGLVSGRAAQAFERVSFGTNTNDGTPADWSATLGSAVAYPATRMVNYLSPSLWEAEGQRLLANELSYADHAHTLASFFDHAARSFATWPAPHLPTSTSFPSRWAWIDEFIPPATDSEQLDLWPLMPREQSEVLDNRPFPMANLLHYARGWVNVPYLEMPSPQNRHGVDCSGYVMMVYRRFGINTERTTWNQWANPNGVHIPKGRVLEPGDSVYFHFPGDKPGPDHAGLYLGRGQVAMAHKTGELLNIVNFNDPYWQSTYIGCHQMGWLICVAQPSGREACTTDRSPRTSVAADRIVAEWRQGG